MVRNGHFATIHSSLQLKSGLFPLPSKQSTTGTLQQNVCWTHLGCCGQVRNPLEVFNLADGLYGLLRGGVGWGTHRFLCFGIHFVVPWEHGQLPLLKSISDFPLLVLKGIYHYWTYFMFCAGDFSKWSTMFGGHDHVHPRAGKESVTICGSFRVAMTS